MRSSEADYTDEDVVRFLKEEYERIITLYPFQREGSVLSEAQAFEIWYSYSKDTLRGIFQMLKASSVMDTPVIKLNLPGKKFHIELPEPYATEVQNAGRALGESIASNGIRYARDFMEIARAIALIRVLDHGLDRIKIVVTEEDMKIFRALVKYINLDFNDLPHAKNPEAAAGKSSE